MSLLLLLMGCNSTNNQGECDTMENIAFFETNQLSIKTGQIEFPFTFSKDISEELRPVDSKQTSVTIGKMLLESLHRKGIYLEYVLLSITHSKNDNVWCYCYSIDQREVNVDDLIDCGAFYVAINGDSGEIIKAWSEE